MVGWGGRQCANFQRQQEDEKEARERESVTTSSKQGRFSPSHQIPPMHISFTSSPPSHTLHSITTAMYGQDQGPKKYGLTVPQKKPLPGMRGRPPPASAAARRLPPGSAFSLDNDDSDGEGGDGDDDLASKASYNKMLQVRKGGFGEGGSGIGCVLVYAFGVEEELCALRLIFLPCSPPFRHVLGTTTTQRSEITP